MKATRPSGGMRALQTRLLAEEEAVPTAAARYYLTETDGDVRAAKAMLRAPPLSLGPPAAWPASPRPHRQLTSASRSAWRRLFACCSTPHH